MKLLAKLKSVAQWCAGFLRGLVCKMYRFCLTFTSADNLIKAALVGAFVMATLIITTTTVMMLRLGWGSVVDALVGILLAASAIVIIMLATTLLSSVIENINKTLLAGLTAACLSVLILHSEISSSPIWVLVLPLIGASVVIGLAVVMMGGESFRHKSFKHKFPVLFSCIAASAFIGGIVVWGLQSGTNEGLLEWEESALLAEPAINIKKPSLPGQYQVKSLTYGSGTGRRSMFAEDVDIKTPTVDGEPLLSEIKGWRAKIRNGFWGFDAKELPLNAQVWYPEAEGKFPLVLMVHGNHAMRDYSDVGYAYLGELLASRGYIFASVDENFLNSDWSIRYKKENDARGWLMLEHLRLWREWEKDSSSPFYQKVDMSNIALMGHSRGGEAVSIASSFNNLSYYPDDATVKFDYGFNIRSVVSISPVDGQYKPTGISTPMENVDYLLFQGAHDSDVSIFYGDRQYKRIKFTDGKPHFKTALYIYRANHGQFNTVWGDTDTGNLPKYLLNRRPLLQGEEQREIAKLYIGGFLDATLKGKKENIPMFQDYRLLGNWLPDTVYINRFENSATHYISDFDEDIDVTTTRVTGGSILAEGFEIWREYDLKHRRSTGLRQNQVVFLGWDRSKESEENDAKKARVPEYRLNLPGNIGEKWNISSASGFIFSVLEAKDKKIKRKSKDPIDFTIVAQDRAGQQASLLLSDIKKLPPPLTVKMWKMKRFEKKVGASHEAVLQSIDIPLIGFSKANKKFNTEEIKSIIFQFDQTEKGVIVLDEIGIRSSK